MARAVGQSAPKYRGGGGVVRGGGAILQEGHWPPQQARSHCSRECEREPEPELGPPGTRGEAVGPAPQGGGRGSQNCSGSLCLKSVLS